MAQPDDQAPVGEAEAVAAKIKSDRAFRRALCRALDQRDIEDELRVVAHAYTVNGEARQLDVISRRVAELEQRRRSTAARSAEWAVVVDDALLCARILSGKLAGERKRNERLTAFAVGAFEAGWIAQFQLDLLLGVADESR